MNTRGNKLNLSNNVLADTKNYFLFMLRSVTGASFTPTKNSVSLFTWIVATLRTLPRNCNPLCHWSPHAEKIYLVAIAYANYNIRAADH